MSREIIYRCDKCGEVIEKPRYVMEITDADTGEAITKDLCEIHKTELLEWIDRKELVMDVLTADNVEAEELYMELDPEQISNPMAEAVAKELERPKRARPKKIDDGKIKALVDAGWDIPKIADEMKLTEAQVRHALSFAEKKESDQG